MTQEDAREDVGFESHGVRLAGWHYSAASDARAGERGRPCVVMAHGFGGTKEMGLAPFAERFAGIGCDVVVFDYRGFGGSDVASGAHRQDVDHRRHREDYHAAVAYARSLDGVDPDRIVLWGSSYSGGHVVAVAAHDPRVAGLVSQCAAMDGLGAVLLIPGYAGLGQLLRLTLAGLRDQIGAWLRRRPHTLPIVGPPGSLGALTSPDSEPGYGSIMEPTFRNEMLARGILRIPLNRPVTLASRVRVPAMVVIAERDSIAPPRAVRATARRLKGRTVVASYDVGHFDIYTGEDFERSVAAQVEFLQSLG